jgi:NhaP-type Na+/H+ or K+/H+ antiporter
MDFAAWSAFVGLVLIVMGVGATLLARLPLSTSMLYLAIGAAASPLWLGWSSLTVPPHTVALERLAEVVVVLSLFTSGLKMSVGLSEGRWRLPLRLASVSMLVTVALIAAAGVLLLGLPLGGAILLGAVLAPTDPVLASDVQISEPTDRDRLRFGLTGEAGLNDGTAFPFVMLGLGLLGLHEIGAWGWRWVAVDLVWATAAGIGIGAGLGTAIGQLVLYLRREHREAVGLDNFLALGLIGLAYGLAIMAHAYGFLAVFAAGVALRRLEQRASVAPAGGEGKGNGKGAAPESSGTKGAEEDGKTAPSPAAIEAAHADPDVADVELATDPRRAPAFMAHAMLSFNEQIERIGEVAAVIVVGMLLWSLEWQWASWLFVAALLLVIRPLSVAVGLVGVAASTTQRGLMAWFGIRGIGSLYYLMYAANHGLDPQLASQLTTLTLSVVVVSIVAHGVSVTPLMTLYERTRRGRRRGREA